MNRGQFVWFELLTDEPDRAAAFYRELLGWEVDRRDDRRVFTADGKAIAEVRVPEGEELGPGWRGYVAVESLAATGERARALGGMSARDGSVIVDPAGAAVGMTELASAAPPAFCYCELMTPDLLASSAYYATLFDWEPRTDDMTRAGSDWATHLAHFYTALSRQPVTADELSPMRTSYGFFQDGREVACAIHAPRAAGSRWLHFALVEDVQASVARALELGAELLSSPLSVSTATVFAILRDPVGGLVALCSEG